MVFVVSKRGRQGKSAVREKEGETVFVDSFHGVLCTSIFNYVIFFLMVTEDAFQKSPTVSVFYGKVGHKPVVDELWDPQKLILFIYHRKPSSPGIPGGSQWGTRGLGIWGGKNSLGELRGWNFIGKTNNSMGRL